jgi:hypothetical protein
MCLRISLRTAASESFAAALKYGRQAVSWPFSQPPPVSPPHAPQCASAAFQSGGWKHAGILSALREKPLKVFEIMKRANIPNEEACQSLLLKMRDDGLVKFDIHKGRWLIGRTFSHNQNGAGHLFWIKSERLERSRSTPMPRGRRPFAMPAGGEGEARQQPNRTRKWRPADVD